MKSIELFAGAGGLAIGTALAGFHHVDVVEWNDHACATMRHNASRGSLPFARHWNVTQGDVRMYDFRQHAGNVDCIFGGPPCQPFSLGGKHRGQQDCRNMFPEAVRAVREIQPKAFMFENVRGLTRQSFANYFSYIVHQLRFPTIVRRGDEEWTDHLARLEERHTSGHVPDLHYHVVTRVLDAANYGVPQHRHRVFFVGVRSDLGVEFSFPDRTHEEDALLYEQFVTGEYWDRHRVPRAKRPPVPAYVLARMEQLRSLLPHMMYKPWRTVRDAISDLPRISEGQTSTKIPNHYLNPGARSYAGHTGSSLDEPSKALKAGDHGVPGGENTVRIGPGDAVRYYSVRECARIQTFPDEWILEGSWTEAMRQLGNAVPVDLARVVAQRLADVLHAPRADHRQENQPTLF
jgi:DNA (cytosine-5)-methyltransferase 1